MSLRVYLPRDTGALACGADAIAARLREGARRRGIELDLIRNGSRGLYWLEPLLEVDTAAGRIGYGPMQVDAVDGLLDAGLATAHAHPLALGLVERIDYLARQQRHCFSRNGLADPLDLAAFRALGGGVGLERALSMSPAEVVACIRDSGLRGRGGAAFPAGIKWQTVLDQPGPDKFIVCNADEGDSGTFADRMVMEGDPFRLIEGMAIAAHAVGARQGYVYLRSEYPLAAEIFAEALQKARAEGWLGAGRDFDIELRIGAGAYICGEETSLLESLEGRRGQVRAKPPVPAIAGLFGRPTVVNNVITLASVPDILVHGADWYRELGSGRSQGTLTIQLGGNIRRGGLIEVPFGIPLRSVLEDFGGGSASGRPLRAVQVGGPLGAYLPPSQFDTPLDYEAFAGIDAMLGHGGIVAFDDRVDMAEQAQFAMEFCAIESCGKCTPCRIGSTRGVEVIERLRGGVAVPAQVELLQSLCDTLRHGSLCALGGLTPLPVLSALRHFPEDFGLARRVFA